MGMSVAKLVQIKLQVSQWGGNGKVDSELAVLKFDNKLVKWIVKKKKQDLI